jgi:hypothetical protein
MFRPYMNRHCYACCYLAWLNFQPWKMEAVLPSETSVNFQQTTLHFPKDRALYNHRCDNLKFRPIILSNYQYSETARSELGKMGLMHIFTSAFSIENRECRKVG